MNFKPLVSFFSFAFSFNIFSNITTFEFQPGLNRLVLDSIDYQERVVLVELPNQIIQTQKYPVIFGFHGAGGSEQGYNRRLAPFVERHQLITVSALGTNSFPRGPKTWNFAENVRTKADDIGLVKKILFLLEQQGLLDKRRVYATGASAGGLFTYQLAKQTDLFAAIAPTKCGMVKDDHKPNQGNANISIFQVIGDQDKSFHGSRGQIADMYSASERINLWTKAKTCLSPPEVKKLENISSDIKYYCPNKTKVRLFILNGIGHRLGEKWTKETDRMIIEFFLTHSKPSLLSPLFL